MCDVGEFLCDDHVTCVSESWLCDEEADCPDASDEALQRCKSSIQHKAFPYKLIIILYE